MSIEDFKGYAAVGDLIAVSDKNDNLRIGELTESCNFFQWGTLKKIADNQYECRLKNSFTPEQLNQPSKKIPEDVINQLCEDPNFKRQYNIYQRTCAVYPYTTSDFKKALPIKEKREIHENTINKIVDDRMY